MGFYRNADFGGKRNGPPQLRKFCNTIDNLPLFCYSIDIERNQEMKWTKDAPKVPGFYWLKRKNWGDVVVEVYQPDATISTMWVILSPPVHRRICDIKVDFWSDVPVTAPE